MTKKPKPINLKHSKPIDIDPITGKQRKGKVPRKNPVVGKKSTRPPAPMPKKKPKKKKPKKAGKFIQLINKTPEAVAKQTGVKRTPKKAKKKK